MTTDSYWNGEARRRPATRRAVLKHGALGIAAIAAAGCGRGGGSQASSSTTRGSTVSTAQPQKGGYLRHLAAYSAGNIDPATTEDSTAYGFVETDWYDPLVRIVYAPSPDWRIADQVGPWLAQSFEQVDPVTSVFHLRQGVKFHNGDAFSAQDVLFSYNRVLDPATKANPNNRMYLDALAKSESPDALTVRLTTKRPTPDFLSGIAGRNVPIVSKRYVESSGDLTKTAVGTGPYKLSSYQKDATALVTRFAESWLPAGPYLDGINILLKTDDSTASAAFAASGADFLTLHDKREAEPMLKTVPKAVSEPFPVEEVHGLVFNQTQPPFSDMRVRLAVHLAIDRQAADEAVNFGEGTLGAAVVVGGKTGWAIPKEELLKLPGFRQPKTQDLTDAKQLMAAAGYSSGFKTNLGYSSTNGYANAYAQVAQAQLKQIGIDATLQPWDNATFTQRRVKPDFEIMVVSEGSMAAPATAALAGFYSTGVYAKPRGINDPDLDKLIEAQGSEIDPAKRGAIFQQIEHAILDKVYKASFGTPTSIRLNQPWIHNWVDNRSAHQTVMNPDAIWMSLDQAPADRRQLS